MHLIKDYLNDYVLKKHDGDFELLYLFNFATIRYTAVYIGYTTLSFCYTIVSICYTVVFIR